ncbi:hypothetical protein JCM3765_006428 [Sporobolomyces pararoseus]
MATTTPSSFGDKLSYAIRYGPLDELMPLLKEASQNPQILDTSDYSLRLLLSTPLQATTRPEAYRCNVFILLLAAGCDPDRRGADGSRVEWEIDVLGLDAKRIALHELKEARSCKREGRSYGIPFAATEWVEEELKAVAELREAEHRRVEEERRMIFEELDREMEEFEASFRPPPPQVPQYEVPEEELMDYEEVVKENSRASPPLRLSDGNAVTIQPDQLFTSAPPPPSAIPMDSEESAPTKARDQSSAPRAFSLSQESTRIEPTSTAAHITSSVKSPALESTSPSLSSCSLLPLQTKSDVLPSSMTTLESSRVESPMSISPGISPPPSGNESKSPALPPSASLAQPSNPLIPPSAPRVNTVTSKPYISPAAALAPKFVTAKPAPGQVGFSLNRLPTNRPSRTVTPAAPPTNSSSSSTVSLPLTKTPSVRSTSRSPPRSTSTTASQLVVSAAPLSSTSPPALPPHTQAQSKERSQSVESSSKTPALVANESPQIEAQAALITPSITNHSLMNPHSAQTQVIAGPKKPKRSRLPSSMKSRLSGSSNGKAPHDASRNPSTSNDTDGTSASTQGRPGGGGEEGFPTHASEVPSPATPSCPNSQYNESSRSRLPPRRPSTRTSSSQHSVTFRKLPDFVTPSMLKHFLTYGPNSFDSIKSAPEVFHLDGLLELGSVKVPEEKDLSIPTPKEVKVWDFQVNSGRAQKRGSAAYGSQEEVEKAKKLFDGTKLVKTGPGGGIEIFIASSGEGSENGNGSGAQDHAGPSSTPKYQQSSLSRLPPKISANSPLVEGGGGFTSLDITSAASPHRQQDIASPNASSPSAAIEHSTSDEPAPITRTQYIAILTKLPPFVTASVLKHYLTWGPHAYDGVTMEQLRDLDGLLESGIVLPPFEQTISEPPPIPREVRIRESDMTFRGAEAVYDCKSDLRKVYKLFGGRKMFQCLSNGGGIGVKI